MMRKTGYGRQGDKHTITLEGTEAEIDALQAMLMGACWVSADQDGKAMREERFRRLPDPVDDPIIPEAWQLLDVMREQPFKYNVANHIPPSEGIHGPSFYLQHLNPFGYTPGRYKAQVRLAQRCGFECLRSRRGNDGKFWEVWYLPGEWRAQNELREFIGSLPQNMTWNQKGSAVVDWLCKNVDFGTLDMAIQRAAAVID